MSSSCEVRAPFLVLAHHRSGSNFLHDLLQAHPAIECINEPLSMHTRFFRQCDLVQWTEVDYDPVLLHRALAQHPGLRDYLGEMRDYLESATRERVIGFKETALFGKLEWLKAWMPSIKLVFLTRDPRAIVSSVLRSELSDFWLYDDLVPQAFHAACPEYESRAGTADPTLRAAEVAAMSVVARQALARRSLARFPLLEVALEDVMREPQRCLREMTDFLGVDPHPLQAEFLAQRQGASRGGAFSSFRAPADVQGRWQRHLSAGQVELVEGVLRASKEFA